MIDESTDEDEDDPNKANKNKSKKQSKQSYEDRMWIENLKMITCKHGSEITSKGIIEFNKRLMDSNSDPIDIDIIPADILANYQK